MKGMVFMPTEIPVLSKEKFIRNCVKWMHICCNVVDYYDASPALNNLRKTLFFLIFIIVIVLIIQSLYISNIYANKAPGIQTSNFEMH